MYAAHAAWEDTKLFPVYRALFTEAELDKLETSSRSGAKLLGASGFEGALKEVGDLEKALGIAGSPASLRGIRQAPAANP